MNRGRLGTIVQMRLKMLVCFFVFRHGASRFLLPAAIVIFMAGCGGKKISQFDDAEETFSASMELYRKGDYDEAASGFQMVIFNHPGHQRVDQAMFYLADSYFRNEDYMLAANEFRRVAAEYPDESFAVVSLYRLGLCYSHLSLSYHLDQKDTKRAIESFNVVTIRFPESAYVDSARIQISELQDKLARKEYESGFYYYKREYFDSAIIYFEILREEYSGSRWHATALYYLSKAYEELDLDDDAVEAREELLRLFPESEEARKVANEHPELREESQASAG